MTPDLQDAVTLANDAELATAISVTTTLQLSPVVETDLRIEVSRRQLQKAALDFMVSIYGKPCDIEDPELKERFYGRLGLLVNFIVEVVPE